MTTETREITSSDDIIDVRDVIARFEELESELPEDLGDLDIAVDHEEYDTLKSLLEELAGNGGDEQWRGDWYPITLIRDSYFQTYAMEVADDIGAINSEATWPNNCIDWERAANELQIDYSTVDFDGIDYHYR